MYNPSPNYYIKRQDFVHPLDFSLYQRIIENPIIKKMLDIVLEQNLDCTSNYLFNSSCIKPNENHPVVSAFHRGRKRFNVDIKENIFVYRSYDFNVKVVGFEEPVILIPSRLFEENNSFLMEERIAVSLASIVAGHNKLDYLLWLYDNFSGLLSFPVISSALHGLICEWERSRWYSLDKAFYLYTNDLALAKMNVLYGLLPYDILKNFDFAGNDTFLKQTKEFYKKDTLIEAATSITNMLKHEIWIPARYHELCSLEKKV